MRTFDKKSEDDVKPDTSTRPAQVRAGRSFDSQSLPNLQRTAGNQAMQRSLGDEMTNRETTRSSSDQSSQSDLPSSLQRGLERISGVDLSGVSVHWNSPKPVQVNAQAYTRGKDIYVGPGQEEYLPHEGWHVVQQVQGRVTTTRQEGGVPINDDEQLEQEAVTMGERASHQRSRSGDTVESPSSNKVPTNPAIQRQEARPPRSAEEVVSGGEQKIRYQAARIQDKYVAILIRYKTALENFKSTLDAPSSKDVEPQYGKVILDYAADKAIGEVADKVPGATYVYEVHKEMKKETDRIAKEKKARNVSEFFKKHNKWIGQQHAALEQKENEMEENAAGFYNSLSTDDEKAKYWLSLKSKADQLDRHANRMTVDQLFQFLSEKWVAVTETPWEGGRTITQSSYIRIELDENWNVTKAHINAPGGQKIADEFNDMSGGVDPLSMNVRKLVYAEGYTLKTPGGVDKPFGTHLSPSNRRTGGNTELFAAIKQRGIPTPDRWSGD